MAMLALGLSQGIQQGLQAYGEAQAIKAQATYQKQLAEFNSRVADFQAADAVDRGERAAQEILKQASQLAARTRAGFAGQGVRVDEGTALEIQQDIAAAGANNAARIRSNAFREAFGFRVDAINQQTRAIMARQEGKFQARQTMLAGGAQAARTIGTATYNADRRGAI